MPRARRRATAPAEGRGGGKRAPAGLPASAAGVPVIRQPTDFQMVLAFFYAADPVSFVGFLWGRSRVAQMLPQ
jgi:hypothetical protein